MKWGLPICICGVEKQSITSSATVPKDVHKIKFSVFASKLEWRSAESAQAIHGAGNATAKVRQMSDNLNIFTLDGRVQERLLVELCDRTIMGMQESFTVGRCHQVKTVLEIGCLVVAK